MQVTESYCNHITFYATIIYYTLSECTLGGWTGDGDVNISISDLLHMHHIISL